MFLFKRIFKKILCITAVNLHYSMFLFKLEIVLKDKFVFKNLHYSMFLFKLRSSDYVVPFALYLHYSMFLFKLIAISIKIVEELFTLQYVSI